MKTKRLLLIAIALLTVLIMVGTGWATVYALLLTADPGVGGSFTNEADYTGYTRKPISFSAADSRSITQSGQVNFPKCTGGSNSITYWAIADAEGVGTGNMLAYGTISNAPVTVSTNLTPFLADGEVVIALDSGGIFTDYANSVLDWAFRGQSLSVPTNIYLALFSTACTDTALGTELTGNNYSRALANSWNAASAGQSTNSSAITFPQATSNWSQAVSSALISGDGDPMFYAPTDLTVQSGKKGRFSTGKYKVTIN